MRTVYHGSIEKVVHPLVNAGRENLDFGRKVWRGFDIIEGGVANDRVIDTVEAFIAGQIDEEKAIGELSKHRPNNQICILRQKVVDKHMVFEKSVKLK